MDLQGFRASPAASEEALADAKDLIAYSVKSYRKLLTLHPLLFTGGRKLAASHACFAAWH